jgi:hypothetical protein
LTVGSRTARGAWCVESPTNSKQLSALQRRALKPFVAAFAASLCAIAGAALANGFSTSHQFAVGESGSATITVPLQVPRGIGGMEPQLALNYSSTSGNGILGLGWSLTGPSSITRCSKNLVTDGERGTVSFGAADRYCLDGQRLEIEPASGNTDAVYGTVGTSYRTERDSFSRITATGGAFTGTNGSQPNVPNSFKVETKAGLILEFGLTANSRAMTNIAAGLGTNTISRWMLQRISDRTPMGSFVEFVYCSGEVSLDGTSCNVGAWSGSTVLHYVRYTNRSGALNGEFAVVFGYESRPDRVQAFHAGSASRQTQRILKAFTYRDFGGPNGSGVLQVGKLVRSYELAYEPTESGTSSIRATNASRIQSIIERDKDGLSLPPLQLTLAPDSVFGMPVQQRAVSVPGVPRAPAPCGGVIANRKSLECP